MKISTFLLKVANISGKMSSSQFILKHREYLCGFNRVLPVLALYDAGKLLPTPALKMLTEVLATEKDPALKDVEVVNPITGEITTHTQKSINEKSEKNPKRYSLFLYVKEADGRVEVSPEEKDVWYADTFQEATRSSYRKMFHNASSVCVEIIGQGLSTFIYRGEAMAELLKKGLPPVCAKQKKSTSSLGWRVSAKSFQAKFSRG